MSEASQAAYEKLRQTDSLKYGDFDVTKEWFYSPDPSDSRRLLVFNPNDTKQNFVTDRDSQLEEFLTIGRSAQIPYGYLGKYFDPNLAGNNGTYDSIYGQRTIAEQAEAKRQQQLADQVNAGQITTQQATEMSNKDQVTNVAPNVYQQAYDEAQQTSGGTKTTRSQPAGEAKTKLVNGERVDVNTGQPYQGGGQVQQAPIQRQLTQEDYYLKPGESVQQYNDRIARTRGEQVQIQPSSAKGQLSPEEYYLKPGESIEAYNQRIAQARGDVPEMTTLKDKYGVTQTQDNFISDPISTIKQLTKDVFKTMGYDQATSEYEKIADELEDLENQKKDEIRAINDNPWLTEGVRLRQIQKAEEKWSDKIDSRVNKLQLLDNVRDDARQQAQFAIGTAISIWDSERKFQQAQAQMAYDQSQREFENSIRLYELQNASASGTSEMQEYLFSVEQGFQGSFLDYKTTVAAAGRAPGGGGGLTPIQLLGFTNQVEDNFRANPAVQNYTQLVNFGVPSVIQELTQNPSSVNDTILMRTLAKITDPTTGVREGEYETFESATGAISRLFVLPKSWVGKGRLTDLGRQQMGQLIQTRFGAAQQEYQNQYNYYNNQTSQVGASLPPPYQVSQQSQVYGPVQNFQQETNDVEFDDTSPSLLGQIYNWLF